ILNGVTHSFNIDVVGNNGVHDFWVLKIDNAGNIQWKECYGGSGNDNGEEVRQTADGGYVFGGVNDSNEDDVTNNNCKHDYWVLKVNARGSIEWEKSFGGTQDDEPYGILQSSDGDYVVAGFSKSNDGDVSGNHGNNDVWLIKILPSAISTFYLDADGDGYGDRYISVTA